MAVGGMAFGFAVFLLTARPGVPLMGGVALLLVGCGTYVLTRPDG
jgi:hypothetical protein